MVCVAKTKITELRGCAQGPVISILGPMKCCVKEIYKIQLPENYASYMCLKSKVP